MAMPEMSGTKQTRLEDMYVGDWIPARYTTLDKSKVGTFSEIGTVSDSLPDLDLLNTSPVLDGKVNLIKVNTGTLVSCSFNIIETTPVYLNDNDIIFGKKYTIGDRDYLIRLPGEDEHCRLLCGLNGVFIPNPENMIKLLNLVNATTFEWLSAMYYNGNLLKGINHYTNNEYRQNYASGGVAEKYNARLALLYIEKSKCKNLYC